MGECPTCAYAATHGCWPPRHGSHCRDCHADWSGTVKAHCTICHSTFASNGIADLHWTKTGHADPASLAALLELGKDGIWHLTLRDGEEPRGARFPRRPSAALSPDKGKKHG